MEYYWVFYVDACKVIMDYGAAKNRGKKKGQAISMPKTAPFIKAHRARIELTQKKSPCRLLTWGAWVIGL